MSKNKNYNKSHRFTTWEDANIDDWKCVLVTEKHIYFCCIMDSDENANTKMYDRRMNLISDNYFAYESLMKKLQQIYKGEIQVTYISPELLHYMMIEEDNGWYEE